MVSHVQLVLSAVTFFLLSAGLLVLGFTLRSYTASELTKRRLPACVGNILLAIGLVFLSRSMFDILSAAKKIKVNIGAKSAK